MRGLLMVECLYHQTTKGFKTMTRRSGGLDAVNGCKATKKKPAIVTDPDKWFMIEERRDGSFHFEEKPTGKWKPLLDYRICKPRYRVGEVLFLKEPYGEFKVGNTTLYNYYFVACDAVKKVVKWKNKLFMPAAAARAYIRITGIECERLLDISDQDCISEGIELFYDGENSKPAYKNYSTDKYADAIFFKPKESFISLYKFANKMKPGAEIPNLWVFCYSFEYLPNYKP